MPTGTREVPLPLLREAVEYDCVTGEFRWRNRPQSHFRNARGHAVANTQFAGRVAGCEREDGYRMIGIGGVSVYAHRAAFALHYGRWPSEEVDHIDRDPRNNAIANLREVTHATNMRNQRKKRHNTSGVTGVRRSPRSGKWLAHISDSGKPRHLGTFICLAHAILARREAETGLGFSSGHGA